MGKTDSTSDERTANNTMRHQYRELTRVEKVLVDAIKGAGEHFLQTLELCPQSRETALARTKIEEAMFWAGRAVVP